MDLTLFFWNGWSDPRPVRPFEWPGDRIKQVENVTHSCRKCRTPVWAFIFTQSGTGHLVGRINYKTVSDVHRHTAICKHSLDFILLHWYPSVPALALVCSRYSTVDVVSGIQHAQITMNSCQDRESLSNVAGSFNVSWANPYQNKLWAKWNGEPHHTVPM